jgi:gliding motility-associated-like protein
MPNFKIFLLLGINLIAFGLISQVANDNCTSAQAITIPASGSVCITSTTVNAISDNTTSSCDTGTPGNEVWFTFIATGSQNTVTVTPQGSPSIQQAIVAIDGTGCADNAFNICNASATNNGTATATWTFAPGTQVWISVESNNGTQGGFQLCITSVTPPPAPGSSCSNATSLCNKSNFSVSTFPNNNNPFQPACFATTLQQPIFYQFTVGASGTCAWQADPAGSTEYDWAMYNITNGCPGTLVCCNWNYGNNAGSPIGMSSAGTGSCNESGISNNPNKELSPPANVVAGNTYLIIIDNYSNNSSGFNFTWGGTFQMAPTAQFTVSPSTACGSANVTITNTSVAASSYNWNFGNGNTSTLQNPPAQNYTTPGTYLISLTTNSLAGCTNTTSQSVTVNANHTITAGADRTVCVNLPMSSISMTLGGGATGASATGLPTGVNATVSGGVVTISGTPTVAGTYNYTVTTSGNSCATATATGIITVIAIPTPTITTNAATCSSAGSATIGNYDPTLTYSFTPSGPTVGSGGVISGLSAGTNYTVIASNGTCNSTASSTFNVSAQLTTPAVPTITTNPATCSAAGTASISNYGGTLTYTFSPSGPTAGASGAISNMTTGTSYTVTAGNGSCTSAPSSAFLIDPQLTTPAVPTITVNPATCSAAGTASISNYGATLTYTFSPSGPTAGASGAISNMTTGTSYTVTAGNGSCTSAPSSAFLIDPQLTTPAVPTITTNPATCSASGTASISNYGGSLTYTFSPSGPTAGATGAISNITAGTSYTLTAGNGSCTSAPSSAFLIDPQLSTPAVPTVTTLLATCSSNGIATVSNYVSTLIYTFNPVGPTVGSGGVISGMIAGTNYTLIAGNGSCSSAPSSSFNVSSQLTAPAVPTITTNAATCAATGNASVSNFDGAVTYTFTPSGPSVNATGLISAMNPGTNYTLTAGNTNCTSSPSSAFNIAAQLITPAAPVISVISPSCSANGSASITNYVSSQTYSFTPSGPSVGTTGSISNLTPSVSYTVTTNNGSCTSLASQAFTIQSQLIAPAIPTTTTNPATCTGPGTANIGNYDGSLTYTFTPSGPSVGAGGTISGMNPGSNYTVIASNTNCPSLPSASFNIAAQLPTPATPTISTSPATCFANGSATITNFIGSQTYTFTPAGPSVGSNGSISGMIPGTNYTVITNNGSCLSSASSSFSIQNQIVFPAIPFQADTLIGCAPFSVILSAANFPGVQYNWSSNGNSIGSGSTLSSVFTEAGCFDINLTVTNSQGCTASTAVNDFICVEANPIVSFTSSPNVFVDNSHNVNFSNNTIGATEYYWDFGDQSSSTENNPSHLYSNIQSGMLVTLTASSALGCISQSTIFINYKEQSLFYVPNSFTPDQDEFNQTWGPVFTQGFDPYNFDLFVFNRWGEIVWESHDSQGRWDGTYGNKGRECADGVYTWKISYKPKETDEKIDITGSIRLIR